MPSSMSNQAGDLLPPCIPKELHPCYSLNIHIVIVDTQAGSVNIKQTFNVDIKTEFFFKLVLVIIIHPIKDLKPYVLPCAHVTSIKDFLQKIKRNSNDPWIRIKDKPICEKRISKRI